MQQFNSIQAIQMMLAPAFAITACSHLLTATSNKWSNTINRIRILSMDKNAKSSKQIKSLLNRLGLIRNAIFSIEIAIGSFVAASLAIGVRYFYDKSYIDTIIIILFLCGMALILAAIVFLILETKKGYKIVKDAMSDIENLV